MVAPIKMAAPQHLGPQHHRSCGHTFPVSLYSKHEQLFLVATPSFLLQPTALLKQHSMKCPTGAVHSGGTSSPVSSIIPKEMVPQQMLAEAGKDFPL